MHRYSSGSAFLDEVFSEDSLLGDPLADSLGLPREEKDDEDSLYPVESQPHLSEKINFVNSLRALSVDTNECGICGVYLNDMDAITTGSCAHRHCASCLSQYATLQVSEGARFFFTISWLEEVGDSVLSLRTDDVVGFRCPAFGCPHVLQTEAPSIQQLLLHCGVLNTLERKAAQQEMAVRQARAHALLEQNQRRFATWVSGRPDLARRCPRCDTMIEKNGGCNHMHCALCQTDFIWTDARQESRKEQKEKKEKKAPGTRSARPVLADEFS